MKAIMDANGVINLTPESGAESFALRHWAAKATVKVTVVGPEYSLTVTQGVFWNPAYLIVNAEPL